MGNFSIPDLRYNPFTQAFTAYGHGYSGNPKEVHTVPNTSPYWIYLNEIPRDDTPSTLFINEQGGSDFTEVSFSTSPAASQFRVAYGGDGTTTIATAGQGIVEFNSADAGKTVEVKYYGLGTINQNQMYNDVMDGDYGRPSLADGLSSPKVYIDELVNQNDDGACKYMNVPSSGTYNTGIYINGSQLVAERFTGNFPSSASTPTFTTIYSYEWNVALNSPTVPGFTIYNVYGYILSNNLSRVIPGSAWETGASVIHSPNGTGSINVTAYSTNNTEFNSTGYDLTVLYTTP